MAIKPVLAFPNKALRVKCPNVPAVTDPVIALCGDLIETMEAATGAGIAAPQVGAQVRVFVVSKHIAKTEEHVVFINPEIEWVSEELQDFKEGCLSFFDLFIRVKRPKEVRISFLDLDGIHQTITAFDYFAQVIQHEYEHLDGKLLVDHAGPVKRDIIKRKFKRFAGKCYDYRPSAPNQ